MADTNGFDSAAWSVDGARIDSDMMRVLAYMGTSGAEGVATATDCKVSALATPGGQVVISTGAVLFRNGSAGVKNQSYVANARTQTVLDVAPNNTGSMRSDIVCVRVEDPEFAGWSTPAPGDAPTYQYVRPVILQNKPVWTRSFADLALPYSGYAFGRIDIPANTSAITNAMIKPLRKVANPRRLRVQERHDIQYAPNESGSVSNVWVHYPDVPDMSYEIPSWATDAFVQVNITGPQVLGSAIAGYFQHRFHGGSPVTDAVTLVTYVNEQIAGAGTRHSYLVSSKVPIPAAMRGQIVSGITEFYRTGGSGYFRSDPDVQVVVDVEFVEAAA